MQGEGFAKWTQPNLHNSSGINLSETIQIFLTCTFYLDFHLRRDTFIINYNYFSSYKMNACDN